MLFFHALLFSLLATSTLAIPVPTFEKTKAAINSVLNGNPIRAKGLWRLRDLHNTHEPMAFVIHIGKSKSVRVLSPKLPEVTGEEMKERLERVFSNSEEWMRMTPGDYEKAMKGKKAPDGTSFDPKYEKDTLTIQLGEQDGLGFKLKIKLNGRVLTHPFEDFILEVKTVQPSEQNVQPAELPTTEHAAELPAELPRSSIEKE